MADYVIGDVHGCWDSLRALLGQLALSGDDRLWLVGDLVNGGPRSLEVLRWAREWEHAGQLEAVLGNHDVYFLGRASGALPHPKARDTLDELLAAPDAAELIDWVRARPLLVVRPTFALFHAGLLPQWSLDVAIARAAAAEAALRRADWSTFVADYFAARKDPQTREQQTLSALVTLRTVDRTGQPDRRYKGPPSQAPGGCRPWFDRRPAHESHALCFGHWAALGLYRQGRVHGLDGGCVWGGELIAERLDDGELFRQPSLEQR